MHISYRALPHFAANDVVKLFCLRRLSNRIRCGDFSLRTVWESSFFLKSICVAIYLYPCSKGLDFGAPVHWVHYASIMDA